MVFFFNILFIALRLVSVYDVDLVLAGEIHLVGCAEASKANVAFNTVDGEEREYNRLGKPKLLRVQKNDEAAASRENSV